MAKQYASVTSSSDLGLKTISSWNARETAGSTAVFQVRLTDGSGQIILGVSLGANESVGDQLFDAWQSGTTFYFELVSGAVRFNAAGSVS